MKKFWNDWSVLVIVTVIVVAAGAFIIWATPSTPEVSKTWTLPDGEVCHTFKGYQNVTCSR